MSRITKYRLKNGCVTFVFLGVYFWTRLAFRSCDTPTDSHWAKIQTLTKIIKIHILLCKKKLSCLMPKLKMFLPRGSSSSWRRTATVDTRQFERKLFSTTTVAWIQWCVAISLSTIKTSFLVLRVRNNQTVDIEETFVPMT